MSFKHSKNKKDLAAPAHTTDDDDDDQESFSGNSLDDGSVFSLAKAHIAKLAGSAPRDRAATLVATTTLTARPPRTSQAPTSTQSNCTGLEH
jgi:hypothetical protein